MQRAYKKRRMLLIIGDPGSGKTTLIKYYALCALEDDHYKRLGFPAPVSVFYLPLRDLLRHEKGHYDSLPANFAHWSEKHHQPIDTALFEAWLRNGTPLILLDGLDEISNTQDRIEVCKWIDAALNTFTTARFVVTSRATGYRKDEGIELAADYERADVQDFTAEQQERFLKNWFTEAFLKEPCPKDGDETEWERLQRAEADERTRKMVTHLKEEKNKGLRQLAAIPMILQIMAILWKDRDYMPESRVKLYEASLDYLLEFRDKRRGIMPPLSAARARQVLAPISLWMQEKLKKDEASGSEMQKKMGEQLDKQDKPPSVEDFCDHLVKRAGLLVETAAHDYLFRHKSFREYLAGVQLVTKVRSTRYLGNLITGFGQDWWEEPIRFFMAQGDEEIFNLFMKKLFDSPVSDQLSQKQQLLLQTIIEEAPLKKVDALCKKLLDPATTASRQRVILDCLKAIGKAATLHALQQFTLDGLAKNRDVADRAEEVFLALGGEASALQSAKSYSGTMRSYRNTNEDNAEYILIPGGNYRYSVTDKTVDVGDLYVAKYPVTNKLYRTFIAWLEAKESSELRSAFQAELEVIAKSNAWGKEFADYLKEGKGDLAGRFRSDYDEDRKYDGADQPVVGVTWYAACAYALWLSMLEGETRLYRLPNEVEWEWAAGGKQGTTGEKVRPYPWEEEKGEPSSTLANYNRNIGETTPVGRYPEGATPEGLYDMAGNVWEWMENWFDKFDKDEDYPALRGAAYYNEANSLRCSSRYYVNPWLRLDLIGFRVIRSSHSSSS
jgi:formylglycine-generating enzyme required for sulfatase activity/energy-coupling factor transporter ATP-binding protein EcfA2